MGIFTECQECEKLEAKIRAMKSLLAEVDQHLAERIIDPCGYDPEKESREDLIALVKSLSEENEALLNRVRGQFKIIP